MASISAQWSFTYLLLVGTTLNLELLTSLLFILENFPKIIYSFRRGKETSWLQAVSKAVIRCMCTNFQVSANSIIWTDVPNGRTNKPTTPEFLLQWATARGMHGFKKKDTFFVFSFLHRALFTGWVGIELLSFLPSYDIRLSIHGSFLFFWLEVSSLPQ